MISRVEVVLVLFVHIVLFCDGASEIALMGSRNNPNSPGRGQQRQIMQGWKEGDKGKKIKFLIARLKQPQIPWGKEESIVHQPLERQRIPKSWRPWKGSWVSRTKLRGSNLVTQHIFSEWLWVISDKMTEEEWKAIFDRPRYHIPSSLPILGSRSTGICQL